MSYNITEIAVSVDDLTSVCSFCWRLTDHSAVSYVKKSGSFCYLMCVCQVAHMNKLRTTGKHILYGKSAVRSMN